MTFRAGAVADTYDLADSAKANLGRREQIHKELGEGGETGLFTERIGRGKTIFGGYVDLLQRTQQRSHRSADVVGRTHVRTVFVHVVMETGERIGGDGFCVVAHEREIAEHERIEVAVLALLNGHVFRSQIESGPILHRYEVVIPKNAGKEDGRSQNAPALSPGGLLGRVSIVLIQGRLAAHFETTVPSSGRGMSKCFGAVDQSVEHLAGNLRSGIDHILAMASCWLTPEGDGSPRAVDSAL